MRALLDARCSHRSVVYSQVLVVLGAVIVQPRWCREGQLAAGCVFLLFHPAPGSGFQRAFRGIVLGCWLRGSGRVHHLRGPCLE